MDRGFRGLSRRSLTVLGAGLAALLVGFAAACGGAGATLVKVDGSSTVFPITEAMAEEFQREHSGVQVTVGISGTGGGFQRFCNGETQVSNASRPIKPVEAEACAASGVEYIELPVAFDGLSVMVHPDNDWVDLLTVDELREIWKPDSTVKKWSDLRAGWPAKEIALVGADTDSGTFDYFTGAIVGEEGASRPDYTASSDDNVLVTAIAREKNSLGYFGFAYYVENTDKLKLVPIDPGTGPVLPTRETISNNTYVPLSRPLFVYVNAQDASRGDVQAFIRYYLDARNIPLVRDVGYIELPEGVYALVRARFEARTTGTVFGRGGSRLGASIEQILGRE